MPPKKKRKMLTSEEVLKDIKSFWMKKIMKILMIKMSIQMNFMVRKIFLYHFISTQCQTFS